MYKLYKLYSTIHSRNNSSKNYSVGLIKIGFRVDNNYTLIKIIVNNYLILINMILFYLFYFILFYSV